VGWRTDFRERNKMVQKRYTVSTKINEQENKALTEISNQENISVSAVMKLFVDALINGDIELEKGELKICTPPHEDCVSEILNVPIFQSKIDKELEKLTEKGYPDKMRMRIEEQISENIRNLPRYDARRMREDDWGC